MSARPHRHSLPVLVALVVTSFVATLTTSVAGAQNVPTAHDVRQDRASRSGSRPCTVSPKLVPSCGLWWGVSPGMWQDRKAGTHAFERQLGARVDIYKSYHFNHELFPTPSERALARQPGHHRLLDLDYVPDGALSWAQVAAGQDDAQLIREARYLKRTFKHKLFISVHHEPEEEVVQSPGSGHRAADFAAMFRHVVNVFRAQGVHNVVWVYNIMGDQGADSEPWFGQLYPGDAYVDWIAADIYGCFARNVCRSFAKSSLNQRFSRVAPWPGFYRWARHAHPRKPIMLSEWGAFSNVGEAKRVRYLRTVRHQLRNFPHLKALVYWDSNRTSRGDVHLEPGTRASAVVGRLARSHRFRQRVH
jgi:hypothetical protein